jgi:hypothetical protein
MTATRILYSAAGSPDYPGDAHGVCRTCGLDGEGLPFAKWVKPTFTDHDKLTAGEIICRACQFCFDDHVAELTRRVGKDKLQRMRNYSHFVVGGEWTPLSKGDKRRMRELLFADPDVAVIAVSGQKHIIFRARPGWWQIEEQSRRPFPRELAAVLDPVETLYAGFAKAEIETGRYSQARILKFGFPRWRELDAAIKPLRGTPALELALFLAQREEDESEQPGDSGQAALPMLAGDE